MNKHQEAFKVIVSCVNLQWCRGLGKVYVLKQIETISELVNKSIPKRPRVVQELFACDGDFTTYIDINKCDTCGETIHYPRCCQNNDCRQAIDWSEYDEIPSKG